MKRELNFLSIKKILNMLIESTHKTENQMNALITKILPCVALYKTLLKADLSNQAMLKAWH